MAEKMGCLYKKASEKAFSKAKRASDSTWIWITDAPERVCYGTRYGMRQSAGCLLQHRNSFYC